MGRLPPLLLPYIFRRQCSIRARIHAHGPHASPRLSLIAHRITTKTFAAASHRTPLKFFPHSAFSLSRISAELFFFLSNASTGWWKNYLWPHFFLDINFA